jgi:predicted dehydrogenase
MEGNVLRVGLVGCGFMGRMHASVYGLLDNAELVAAADKTPDKAHKLAPRAYASLDEMLASEELDAVDICLPTFQHRDATVRALAAGKHVFCEKPMALTADEAAEMQQAADAAGRTLMIGHCIRFWPEYALLKQFADEGRLGKLLSINLTRYGEFPSWSSENWLADESKAGGGALDMHIHDTDFALFLLGEPDEVVSYGSVDERGASHAFTTMRFGDAVAHLEGGWNLPPKTPFKMAFRAIFERGAMIMDGGPLTVYEAGKEPVVPEFPKMEAAGGGNISDLGGYYHEIKYFVDRVAAGEPLEIVTPQTSRRSLEVTLEEIRQIKERARVPAAR